MSQVDGPKAEDAVAGINTDPELAGESPTLALDEAAIIKSIVENHDEALSREQLLGEESVPEAKEAPANTGDAPKADAAVAAPTEDDTPAEEKPSFRNKKLQLLASKERELREREQALKERESSGTSEADFIRRLIENPTELLEKHGLTSDQAATVLWGKSLGDEAPEDFKRQADRLKSKNRVDILEAKLEQALQMAEQAQNTAATNARIEIYDDTLKRYARTDIPDDLHFLKVEAEQDAKAAYEAIAIHVSGQMYDGEGNLKPSSDWPSAAEAARAVNDAMKADWERFSPTAAAPTPRPESTTLATDSLSASDSLQPTRTPPSREDFSDEQWEKLAERTLRTAMRAEVERGG
jgi:hypothetical protein